MLKLRYDTEDWRNALIDCIDRAELVAGVPSDATDGSEYDDLAGQLCVEVLSELRRNGVDYERAYQQSVGAFVIVQDGEDDEREAFDAAFEKCEKEIYPDVLAKAREFAEELAEDVED